jgi:hypothetical protein
MPPRNPSTAPRRNAHLALPSTALLFAIVPFLTGCELFFPLSGFEGDGGAGGAGPRPPGLLCGDASCPPSSIYECCLPNNGTEDYREGMCTTSCPGDIAFECERKTDCPDASVCCTGVNSYTSSTCVPTPSDCRSGGSPGSLLCDPNGSSGECPAGQTCYPTVGNAYPGLATCGPS